MNGPQNGSERDRLLAEATREFLERLPAPLAEAVWAAAIPHWFDGAILARILGVPEEDAAARYARLQEMPFVQPVAGRGHAVHELTRRLLLDDLWRERREAFRAWSCRAAEAFESRPDDPDFLLESIYHYLVADPDRGADRVWNWGAEWSNTFQYARLHALVQVGLEHEEAGRLEGRARGWIFLWKGRLYVLYGEYRMAEETLEQALVAKSGDRMLKAECMRTLGETQRKQSRFGAARARYEEALSIYREIGDRLGEANCIWALGDVLRGQAEYEMARAYYEEALGIYREIGNRLGEANSIKALGDIHRKRAEYQAAQNAYEKALSIYRDIGAPLGKAYCVWALGEVYRMRGIYGTAQAYYKEALSIYRETGDRMVQANCIQALGDIYYTVGDYEAAHRYYEEALRIYEEIGTRRGEAYCIRALGDIRRILAEYQAAQTHYEKALGVYEEIGDRLGQAFCFQSLGDLWADQGEIDKALAFLDEAEARFSALGLPARVAWVHNSRGNLWDRREDYAAAVEAYTRAIQAWPQEGAFYRNRAGTFIEMGDFAAAAADLEHAATLAPEHPYLALRRGQLAFYMRDYPSALRHAQEALARRSPFAPAALLTALAHLALGDEGEATRALETALHGPHDKEDLEDALRWLDRLPETVPPEAGERFREQLREALNRFRPR